MDMTARFVFLIASSSAAEPAFLDEIVVPLDGSSASERAVPIAADLAARLGAGIRLLTTMSDVDDRSPASYLGSLAERVAGVVEVTTDVVLDAEPAESILAAMHPGRVGVCMATHARGRFLGALHQGVTETVVAARRGPVFLIGPSCISTQLSDGPVLFAHDGTGDATEMAHGLLPLLAAVSTSLTLVTVVPAPMGKSADDPYHELKRIAQSVVDDAVRQGTRATHRLAFATDVRRGLLDEIADIEPSLVVMAAHHHTLMQRLREGSTTAAITHSSAAPVLVI